MALFLDQNHHHQVIKKQESPLNLYLLNVTFVAKNIRKLKVESNIEQDESLTLFYRDGKFLGASETNEYTDTEKLDKETGEYVTTQKDKYGKNHLSNVAKYNVPIDEPKPITSVILTVISNVYNDSVFIDDEFKGSTRLDIRLPKGEHKIRVEKENYRLYEKIINLQEPKTIKAKLYKLPGRLLVEIDPSDAVVRILKQTMAYKPGIELQAGFYNIEVSKKGFNTVQKKIHIKENEETRIKIKLALVELLIANKKNKLNKTTFKEPVLGMEFVLIPGGCFMMGNPKDEPDRDDDEGPVHKVCLDAFWMGKYEVTVGQFSRFVKDSGNSGNGGNYWRCEVMAKPEKLKQKDNHPVACIME